MPAAAEASLTLLLPDEAATARLAEDIAIVLQPGDVVALSGGLGAGKTTFARALLRSLAGDPSLQAESPTYPLRIDHALRRIKVAHADLYRLQGESELEELGLDEAVAEGAVLVEWPEKLPEDLSEHRLDLAFTVEGEARRVTMRARGSWPARLARTARIRAFLDGHGWRNASRSPLAGDASTRAYERVTARREGVAILMNAPARPEGPPIDDGRSYDSLAHRSRNVRAFVALDGALRAAGVRAPEILSADLEAGLLLLEDLGADGVVDESGAPILSRYEAAIDLLVFMHGRGWPDDAALPNGERFALPRYDREALLVEVSLFPDWFARHAGEGEKVFPADKRSEFLAAWSSLIERIDARSTTWVMRDFHSPNILWQADSEGIARVGIIDFQDALIGHPAYDAASLAQDARVSIDAADEARLKARYLAGRRAADPRFDAEAFDAAYAILGLQRATKVLGIFTRLALAEGKPGYQRHRERLKAVIRRNLADPVLSGMRLWYEPFL